MASESTTTTTVSTVTADDFELRSLEWWADLEDDPVPAEPRRIPPVPAFVRLSRLIDPEQVRATRGIDAVVRIEPQVADPPIEPSGTNQTVAPNRGWADSAGRPLFQIGLAAIVAAVVVGVSTFGPGRSDLSTVESPAAITMIEPDSEADFDPVGDRAAKPDGVSGDAAGEQTHEMLEALVRQTGGDSEADLSLVGTASGSGSDIRWTATVRNEGPDTALGPIAIMHTIGSTFELVAVSGTGWECEHRRAAGTIACELDEDLATGQRRRLGLVTSGGAVTPGARVPSTMSVIAGSSDPDLENNVINVTAVSAPLDGTDEDTDVDVSADAFRSRSTGAAGTSGSETDVAADLTETAGSDDAGASATTTDGTVELAELPRTGSGLALVLGAAGLVLCLTGRRMTAWSARVQTRTLLVAANIN